jgi:hypothetical protein
MALITFPKMPSKLSSAVHPLWRLLAFGLLVSTCLLSTSKADETELWGAVLLAKNGTPPQVLPSELKPYQERLSRVFGYESFQVLSKSTQKVSDGDQKWLIPGKAFSVRSTVKPTDDDNFRVELQLYQAEKEMVQTVAKLGPRSPLFIRGPLYGTGQLIIAIMVSGGE